LQIAALTGVAALTGALVLSGCGKKEAKEDTAAPEQQTAQTGTKQDEIKVVKEAKPAADETTSAAAPKPEIKLIAPGAEPRHVLRYKLAKGGKEKLAMTMDMTMQTKVPGMEVPEVKVPTLTMVMDMEITDALPNEEFSYEFVMSDAKLVEVPGANAQMAKVTQEALDQAKGLRGQAIVNSRGFNRDAKVEFPETMMPQMQEMLAGTIKTVEQMSSPLPDEPVGKGAKWEIRQQIEQNGMKIDQVTLFELMELSGDNATLKAEVTQNAGQQTLQVPGGMGSATLMWLKSKGSGEVKLSLNRMVPDSKMDIASDYAMKVDANGQSQVIEAHMSMNVQIAQQAAQK
jgi:outer membrane murein-binding lipoprotein Lpp